METTTLPPEAFAAAMQEHYIEGAEDFRQVTVGLRGESRFAEIYQRFAHLYTPEQLESLGEARDAGADDVELDRFNRLWFEAADALAAGDVIQAAQDLMNERLAWRTTFDGEELSINGLGALIASEPDFDRRESIYALMCQADDEFVERDLELSARSQELRSAVFALDGEIAIANARMGIDVRRFSEQINDVSARTSDSYTERAALLFPELLGSERAPSRAQAAYLRAQHIHDSTYSRERMADVCATTVAELGFDLDQIPTIFPDLEDRPDKDPRACVVPVRVPEEVHLIVRPTGGISDYQAFLHEAGHALHFGLSSAALPFEHRYLSPDNALTEIYSYVVERITHEPLWHERHFGLSPKDAERACAHTRFVDASLFRRYGAKLAYELEFWADPRDPRNPKRYSDRLTEATRMTYPPSQFVSDMDPGLYAADYLRAWRTSLQVIEWLRAEHGPEWFCSGAAAPFLLELFEQGTAPTNESISYKIGSSPDDFDDLVHHLSR